MLSAPALPLCPYFAGAASLPFMTRFGSPSAASEWEHALLRPLPLRAMSFSSAARPVGEQSLHMPWCRAKDLIRRLLVVDPLKRLTCKEVRLG